MSNSHRMRLLATSVLAMPLLAAPALAADEAASNGIQEIVVTAQRQAQSILTVPMAIQAVSGDQLNNIGVHDLNDLGTEVPGYLPSKGSGYTQIFIRGIGNSVYVGPDPSVATYIDDVPRIYGSLVSHLFDVDRIEVLKGAQGGLYGRNATGGVVNIITNQPDTEKFHGRALVDYGEYNTVRVGGLVNVPITDHAAFLISAEHDQHDDYFRNVAVLNPYKASFFPNGSFLCATCFGNGQATANYLNSQVVPSRGGNQNITAGDAKLLIQPTDNFKVTVAADYSIKKDTEGGVLQQMSPAVAQIYLSGLLGNFAPGATLPPGTVVGGTGKFDFATGSPTPVNNVDYGGSITADLHLSGADIKSITAYRHQHTLFGTELNGAAVPILTAAIDNFKHFFYQELRAVSNGDGPWHWLGGVTYLNDHFAGYSNIYLLGSPIAAPVCSICQASHINPFQDIEDGTVYGQVGYDITPDLNVTFSSRYLIEHNDVTFVDPVVAAKNSSLRSKETAFIPSATISYKLGHGMFDEGTVYARYARGFKAGGINLVANPASFIAAGAPLDSGEVFKPEKVDTYEIGIKGSVAENKVHFSADVFFNDYRDLQNSSVHAKPAFTSAVILAIINVPHAQTYGAEETLQVKVAEPLTLGANAAYLHARYLSDVPGSAVLDPLNIAHTTMTNSPTWMMNFTANLDTPINDRYKLIGNLVERYVSKTIFNFGSTNILGVLQPAASGNSYWLTNLRIGVATSDDRYQLAFFANNVFNKYYRTQATSASVGLEVAPGDPRVVGAELIAKF